MRLGAALALACFLAHAQTSDLTRFEVASVKPSAGKYDNRGGPGTSDPGQIVYGNWPLRSLIFQAYNVRVNELIAPEWMIDARFDLAAKLPARATFDDLRVMLQNLLSERFELKLHRETREMQAYGLTVGKNGAKMTSYPMELPEGSTDAFFPHPTGMDKDGFFLFAPGATAGMMGTRDGVTRILLVRKPMAELCDFLSRVLQTPVVNQTGLTARYDAHLKFAAESEPPQSDDDDAVPVVPNAPELAPSLFRAIENQLGLKLERKKLPVDFLVVDAARKTPIEN